MSSQDQLIEDVYAREVVMARVGHLIRRKQQEIERITRILRAAASFEGVAAPVPGEIEDRAHWTLCPAHLVRGQSLTLLLGLLVLGGRQSYDLCR